MAVPGQIFKKPLFVSVGSDQFQAFSRLLIKLKTVLVQNGFNRFELAVDRSCADFNIVGNFIDLDITVLMQKIFHQFLFPCCHIHKTPPPMLSFLRE